MGIHRFGIAYTVTQRWFGLWELLLALSAGGLLLAQPQLTWLALIMIFLPGLLRLLAGQFLTETKTLDFLLGIFLLSAAIALWSAYDEGFAQRKFWILVSGVMVFYALSRQPRENRVIVWGLLAVFPVVMAGYFLLTHDWLNATVKMTFITQLGEKWMQLRPDVDFPALHPNRAAGLIGLYLPFLFALALRARFRKRWMGQLILFAGFLFSAAGMILSASRGSWIAVIFSFGAWFFLARGKTVTDKFRWAGFISLAFLGLLAVGVVVILILNGQESGISRLELFQQGTYLVRDYPFIGAGLGAFPGLFSRYIRGIPFFFFSNGHNIFLDIAIEQGVPGFLAFSGVILWSIFSMGTFRPNTADDGTGHFRYAVLASLFFLCIHGFVTNTLYAEQALPILFTQAGAAVMLRQSQSTEGAEKVSDRPFRRSGLRRYTAFLLPVGLVLLMIFGFRPLASSWIANQAAVEMARIELADFPRNAWEEGEKLEALASLKLPFERALYLDDTQLTAHYRLGLLNIEEKDFASAVSYLETAYALAPGHRGVVKSLGFGYVWLGRFSEAAGLLEEIPEAQEELTVYAWWWQSQSRDDLSGMAQEMLLYLENSGIRP